MPSIGHLAPDDPTVTPGADHPLAEVFRVVATWDRRFDPHGTSARPVRPLAELRSRIGEAGDSDRSDGLARRIAALSLAFRLGTIGAPAITTLAATRRLPDLSEGNVFVDVGVGPRIDRFSLGRLTFYCLADDPAADHPDAVVVDSVPDLRGLFRVGYARAWLVDCITALEAGSPLNAKALWGMVASGWASSAGSLAAVTGDPGRAIEDVQALLDAELPAGRGPLAFYVDDRADSAMVRHWRGVCCLTYRLPGNEMCEGECPLLPAGRVACRMPDSPRSRQQRERTGAPAWGRRTAEAAPG